MHKKLVAKAFEKVKKREKEKLDIDLSDTQTSDYLSIILKEEFDAKISDRTLRDVYNGIKQIRKPNVILALCKFLKYKDYQDFLKSQEEKPVVYDIGGIKKEDSDLGTTLPEITTGRSKLSILEENKVVVGFTIIALLASIIIYLSTKQRWMIWAEDHYIEVDFDTKKYEIGQLKLYKEERIKYFKKIKLNCDYVFFDKEGNPKIWYGKNIYGDLQLFTSHGLHPETGITLKPISYYMINKYICD